MGATIEEREAEVIAELKAFPDWKDRYRHLMELGRALPPMPEDDKTETNRVKGCQSQVWLTARCADGLVHLQAASDSAIVSGLVALVLRVYSGQPSEAILRTPPQFINELGLGKHLTQARANGLAAMVKQVKLFAFVFAQQALAR